VRATAPKTRRVRCIRGLLGATGVAGLLAGMVATGGPAFAEGNCENVAQYEVKGAADGLRVDVAAETGNIVKGADGALPGAMARLHSVDGSKGWAGAPYTSTVAENLGLTGDATGPIGQPELSNPDNVPVFAIAQYPATTEAKKELPAGGLEAKSAADSASGKAAIGAASSEAGSVGSITTTASAACASDMTLEAVADSVATGIDIGGVLRIGSIRSHARVVLTASGERQVEGTVQIDGASVGGQAVSITEKGVVLAGSASALPADPVTPALEEAGISVTYVKGVENTEKGQILAPTLEIAVSQDVPTTNGAMPTVVTFDFGRALALATLDGVTFSDAPDDFPEDESETFSSDFADAGFGDELITTDVATDLPDSPGGSKTPSKSSTGKASNVGTAARIADWSIAPGYSAMGIGALLLLAAWVGLERIAVRLRWR
jgi:hypothetical protein